MGATDAVRYIHLGWILALIAGGLTWLATQTFLTVSGQNRESMEGFISSSPPRRCFTSAIGCIPNLKPRSGKALSMAKCKMLLTARKFSDSGGISFFAVYREAFEVVLFYQALWLQSTNEHHLILWGFVAGLGHSSS